MDILFIITRVYSVKSHQFKVIEEKSMSWMKSMRWMKERVVLGCLEQEIQPSNLEI